MRYGAVFLLVFVALTGFGQIGFKGVNVINSTNRFLSFGEGGVSIVGVQGGTFVSGGVPSNALLHDSTGAPLLNDATGAYLLNDFP